MWYYVHPSLHLRARILYPRARISSLNFSSDSALALALSKAYFTSTILFVLIIKKQSAVGIFSEDDELKCPSSKYHSEPKIPPIQIERNLWKHFSQFHGSIDFYSTSRPYPPMIYNRFSTKFHNFPYILSHNESLSSHRCPFILESPEVTFGPEVTSGPGLFTNDNTKRGPNVTG